MSTVPVCPEHRLVLEATEASFLKHCPRGHSLSKREGWAMVPSDQVKDGKHQLRAPTHVAGKKPPTPIPPVRPMAAAKPVSVVVPQAAAEEVSAAAAAAPAPTEAIPGTRIKTCGGCGTPFTVTTTRGPMPRRCPSCASPEAMRHRQRREQGGTPVTPSRAPERATPAARPPAQSYEEFKAGPPPAPGAPPLSVPTTYQCRAYLQQLVDTGLYGRDLADAASRLIDRALAELLLGEHRLREVRP